MRLWTSLAAVAALLMLGTACAEQSAVADRPSDSDRRARATDTPLAGDQVFPESVAVDRRTGVYYVGSVKDGTIYRGKVGSTRTTVFSPAGAGGRSIANGLALRGDTLVVLSRQTGVIRSYDTRNGALLSTVDNGLGSSGTFLNDLVVARDGSAYVTDSKNPWLYRITWRGTTMTLTRSVEFAGTPLRYVTADGPEGINLNGIVASPDGRYLVVSKRNENALYRITLADRSVRKVRVPAGVLETQDGLFLDGRTLYAAQNDPENVVALTMDRAFTSARLRRTYTDPSYMFPTGVAVHRGRLLVVSSQFDALGSPAEVTGDEPPELPFRLTTSRA